MCRPCLNNTAHIHYVYKENDMWAVDVRSQWFVVELFFCYLKTQGDRRKKKRRCIQVVEK
jgi:hypothetical protein